MLRIRPFVAAIFAAFVVFSFGNMFVGRSHGQSVDKARSADIFNQMMPVFQSPRCMNCHTATDFPRQGDDRHRHIMLIVRGSDDHGSPALRCQSCHQDSNSNNSGVPGAPDWHLAPPRMAWEGLSAGALCRLFLDPARGALTPEKVLTHMQTKLVQWAWSPGVDLNGRLRAPPPVSRDAFIGLTVAWVRTGAACPS